MKNKLPVLYQTEPGECGLVCLSMILNHYEILHSRLSLRRHYCLASNGITARQLVEIASQYGLMTSVFHLKLFQLNTIRLPAILFWKNNHFVVLKAIKNNIYIVHDPVLGIRKLKTGIIADLFSGVVLEMVFSRSGCADLSVNNAHDQYSLKPGLNRSLLYNIYRFYSMSTVFPRMFYFMSLFLVYLSSLFLLFYYQHRFLEIVGQDKFQLVIITVSIFSLITLLINTLSQLNLGKITIHFKQQLRQRFIQHAFSFAGIKEISDYTQLLLSEYKILSDFSASFNNVLLEFIWYGALAFIFFFIISFQHWVLCLMLFLSSVFQFLLLLVVLPKQTDANAKMRRSQFDETLLLAGCFAGSPEASYQRLADSISTGWKPVVTRAIEAETSYGFFVGRSRFFRELIFMLDFAAFAFCCSLLIKNHLLSESCFYVLLLYKQIFTRSFAFTIDKWTQLSPLLKFLPYFAELAGSDSDGAQC